MADLTTEEVFGKPTAATSDEGMSTEDVFGTPPASKPASAGSQLKKGFENVAAVTDMVLGLPGQALMVGADIGGRLKATVQGGSRRDAEFAGKALSGMVSQGLTAPIQTLMEAVGYKGGYQGSDVSRVMESAMGLIHRGGEWVDKKTGGVVSTADVESLVNIALLAAGGRGTAVGVDPWLARMGRAPIPEGQFAEGYRGKFSDEPRKAREMADELQRAEAEAAGLEAAPIATPGGRLIPKVDKPVPQAARSLAEERTFQQQEARARAQKRADVRAAFADEPGQADIDAAYGARQEQLRAEKRALPPSGERTRPVTATRMDEVPRILEQNDFGDLTVTAPAALDRGLAKINRGRPWDLDAQELAAVNASKRGGGPSVIQKGAVDQKLLTAMALGATGLGLAMAYEPDPSEAALAIGGALMLGKGPARGLTMEALRSMPEASALGTILERSPYTLKTLDRLPQNRTEFPRQLIEEQLKRADVTQAEKDVFKQALEGAGDKVSAKQLMVGVKEATGDWELARKSTDQFAGYGLEAIHRAEEVPSEPGGWEVDYPSGTKPVPAETTIYQLPSHMEMGVGNHFSDPRYFGHTRSFEEGGVRHVVEVQSDLAQKAGKVLTEGERTALIEEYKQAESMQALRLKGYQPARDSAAVNSLTAKMAEIKAKLADAAVTSQLSPILKSWPRRLVREELAAAAERGEPVVRIATADTVAKVERWPEPRSEARYQRDDAQYELDQAKENGYTPGEYTYDYAVKVLAEKEAALAAEKLPRFRPEHQSIYDRHVREVEKFAKSVGGKEVTDSTGNTWIETPVIKGPRQMLGGVDQDLANRIAVIGGGAALTAYLSSPENKVENAGLAAAIGGLALYAKSHSPAVADWAQSAGRGAEYGLGMVSTRVGNMSKPLLHRMREHERRVLTSTHENLNAVAPFVERLRKVPASLREELNAAILTNDSARIIKALGKTGDPEIVREWKNVRALLETTGQDLVKTGKIKGMLPDYYPRMVIDVPGLLKALGTEERSFLQKRLDEASREAMLKSGRDLTPLETSNIINKVLKSSPSGGKPGFLKGRSVGEVTKELAPFYAPATESLPLYLRAVSRELERARFFGDDLVRPSEGGPANVDLSIGNVVNRERLAGRITDEQVDDLRSMLTSRFGPGERASSGPIQTFKNLTNAGLLGHFTSAVVQAGDIALSAAANGLLPTVKALQQTITRNPAKIDVRDLGLVNHITEEITGGSKKPLTVGNVQISSAKFLDKVFKYSGFSLVDQLGKTTSINAAAIKFRDLAKTEKGIAKIREKYGEAYGPEFDDLVADLRSGELTDNVKGMLFSELSDIQPISKLEVPQAYLDMPNGRVVYMLKTYMLKQADIVRRNVIQEVKKGNYSKATDSALRFGLALGISGATTEFIRNWMLGRDDKLEWGDIPENIMKTYAWSQYVVDKARRGEPVEAFGGALIPPYQMYDEIAAKDPKALQYLPVIGRLLYAHGAGGAELANMKAWERARKEDRLGELTDSEIKARKEEALRRRLERYRQEKP